MARSDPAASTGEPPRRRLALWLSLAVAAILIAAGFLWWRARSQTPRYVTATVTRGAIQRNVSTTGALNPVVTVQVGSYVSGTVKALHCDYNTEVVVGQVCATIDPLPFQLVVAEDQAQVKTVEAQLKKDRAARLYAETELQRDSKLLGEGTVSQETVDNDRSAFDQATAQIGLDEANAADKRAALKAAQVNLAYTNIVSPVVGTVITRSIDVGQTVAASLQAPTLFLIGKDLSKMQVDSNVSEADIGAVRVGQDAFFGVQAFPGRTFRGRVRQIRRGPITVQNIVTYDVVVAFDNPRRLLFPGMTADTHIVTAEHDGVLRVPLPAIRFDPEGAGRARGGGGHGAGGSGVPRAAEAGEARGPAAGGDEGRRGFRRPGAGGRGAARRARVWVLQADGSLQPVAVTVGLDDGNLVEVSGPGLHAGDRVVVNEVRPDERRRNEPAPGQQQNQVFRQGGRFL